MNDEMSSTQNADATLLEDAERRRLLALMSVTGIAGAFGVSSSSSTAAEEGPMPVPRRALTGRDESGKSIFRSFDVTPRVVTFESRAGLVFWEIYSTEGSPALTGREPDPMATTVSAFPGPTGTLFRMVLFPPRPPEGTKPSPDAFDRFMKEAEAKLPGWVEHANYERNAPGMHTTDTVDYGVVIRGEMTLELDDGKTVHLRQGDCVVQNGTRHRWRNPLPEPCLMAFVLVGARRSG